MDGWLEERTGLPSALRRWKERPLPGGPRWSYSLGGALLALLLVQATTGIALSLSYSPSVETAHASVRFITDELFLGRLIRSLHAHGANFTVTLLILTAIRLVLARAYRSPREVQWLVGVALGLVVLATAITGYVLPWDQYGYWGTQVRVSIMGSAPLVGPGLKALALGGPEPGNLTLTRFYTAHALLFPAVLALLLPVYFRLAARQGVPEPQGGAEPVVSYWPRQAARDAGFALAVVTALFGVAWAFPVRLGEIADPQVTYPARPEWYFLWLFQTLKSFRGPLEVVGTLLIPLLVGVAVALPPFLDRGVSWNGLGRKAVLGILTLLIGGWVSLSALALWEDTKSGHFEDLALWEATPDEAFDVEGFYKKKCAKCHGRDGAGYLDSTPDFTLPEYWAGAKSDFRLLKAILEGVSNESLPEDEKMPAFGKDLEPGQAKALVIWKLRPFGETTTTDGR